MIKAVIFDVGGVLQINKKRSIHKIMAKKLKIDLDAWFDAINKPHAESNEGKITKSQALKEMSICLQIDKKKFEKKC